MFLLSKKKMRKCIYWGCCKWMAVVKNYNHIFFFSILSPTTQRMHWKAQRSVILLIRTVVCLPSAWVVTNVFVCNGSSGLFLASLEYDWQEFVSRTFCVLTTLMRPDLTTCICGVRLESCTTIWPLLQQFRLSIVYTYFMY